MKLRFFFARVYRFVRSKLRTKFGLITYRIETIEAESRLENDFKLLFKLYPQSRENPKRTGSNFGLMSKADKITEAEFRTDYDSRGDNHCLQTTRKWERCGVVKVLLGASRVVEITTKLGIELKETNGRIDIWNPKTKNKLKTFELFNLPVYKNIGCKLI